MENNQSKDWVGIDVMLPVSTINQYSNMKYNNEHHDLLGNEKISTPKY